MKGLRLIVLTVFAGNLVVAGLSFAFQVGMARLFSVADFGHISLLLSLIAITQPVLAFGFPGTAVVHLGKSSDQERTNKVINGWFLVTFGIVFLMAQVAGFAFRSLFQLDLWESSVLVIVIISLHLYEYRLTRRQQRGLWAEYNKAIIIRAVLRVAFGLGFTFFVSWFKGGPASLEFFLWGYLAWSAIMALLGFADSSSWGGVIWPWRTTPRERSEFLALLARLGAINIFAVVSMRSASLIIDMKIGSEALGIFSAANTLALIMPVLTNSIMKVFLRAAAADGNRVLTNILDAQKRYWPWVLAITILGVLASRPLIIGFFGHRYDDAAVLFKWLLIAYIGGVVFTPLESYFYSNRQSFVMKVKGLQMVLIAGGSLIVATRWGLIGVVFVLIAARLVGWTLLMVQAYKTARTNRF